MKYHDLHYPPAVIMTRSCSLFLLLIFAWCITTITPSLPWDLAEITPADPLVFFGETLKLQCMLNSNTQADFNISDVVFEVFARNHLGLNTRTISGNNLTVVDGRTMFATIKVDEFHTNITYYKCSSRSQRLTATYVYAERPIKNITNFKGTYFYEGAIKLSWELGENYLDLDFIKVTVDYNGNTAPNLSGNSCSEQTRISCIINNFIGPDILFIRIRVNSTSPYPRPSLEFLTPLFETSATSVHKFIPIDNMQTSVPAGFIVVDQNSTCMNVTWSVPSYFVHCNCSSLFSIEVKKEGDLEFRLAAQGVTYRAESVQVCSLTPFTVYNLSVQVKAKEMNPWSGKAFAKGETKQDKPLTGPPITDTSYFVYNCVDNKRKVIVYWNTPTKTSLQGQLTHYEVVIGNKTDLVRSGFNYYETVIACNSEQSISIYTSTRVGSAAVPSKFMIPEDSDSIPVLQGNRTFQMKDLMFQVEELLSDIEDKTVKNISVTWQASSLKGENVTLIFYRCQEAGIHKTCLFDFTTTEVKLDKEKLFVSQIPVVENLFGYALRGPAGFKQGIQWTDCVYIAKKVPNKSKGLLVRQGQEDNSLLISWMAPRCNRYEKTLIHYVQLYICPQPLGLVKDCNYTLNITAQHTTGNNYTAKNLENGWKYYVYLQVQSPAGVGPKSDPEIGIPTSSRSLTTAEIVIIIVILCVFTMGPACFMFIRKCELGRRHYQAIIKSDFILPLELLNDSKSGFGYNDSNKGDNSNARNDVTVPPILPSGYQNQDTSVSGNNTGASCSFGQDKKPLLKAEFKSAKELTLLTKKHQNGEKMPQLVSASKASIIRASVPDIQNSTTGSDEIMTEIDYIPVSGSVSQTLDPSTDRNQAENNLNDLPEHNLIDKSVQSQEGGQSIFTESQYVLAHYQDDSNHSSRAPIAVSKNILNPLCSTDLQTVKYGNHSGAVAETLQMNTVDGICEPSNDQKLSSYVTCGANGSISSFIAHPPVLKQTNSG